MTIETPAWVRDAVFYQIFPDRFARSERVARPGPFEPWDAPPTTTGFKGGDLLGVVEHLDHLVDLGVTAIYLNPIFQSASNHRYHTYDYFKVDPLLGGDEAFRELLDACHARGIRVVLDGVFNHASRGFWPFNHVLEVGAASPYRNWFHFNQEHLEQGRPLRAYAFEPSHGSVDLATVPEATIVGLGSLEELGYKAWWNLPALPKLNTENPLVREYLLTVAEHWLRFGIDGWRLDVAEEVPDDFWREFRQRVKAINPDAYIVAEIWHEKPQALRGDMYDALMNYPLAEAIISFVGAVHLDRRVVGQHFTLDAAIKDDDGPAFARRLEHLMSIHEPTVAAVQLNLLDSHDTPRFLSMVGGDVASLRLATVVQMTLPGAPCIYYGDEIGMAGELDPGSRGAFPWHDADRWDHDLLAFVRGAVALRHAHPVLRHGAFRVLAAAGRAVAYLRSAGDDAIVVVVNAGDGSTCVELDMPDFDGRTLSGVRWRGGPDTGSDAVRIRHGRTEVDVEGRDAVVLRAAPGSSGHRMTDRTLS